MACCGFANGVNRQFTKAKAAQELQRYHRRGARPTTRLLLEGLSQTGRIEGTLLDVGAGVGALTFELLERGMESAVVVEASNAYAETFENEAMRRGRDAAVRMLRGDLLDVAERVERADVVTMDRVVCCYPLYAELLREALQRATRTFAFSYPRDCWYSPRSRVGRKRRSSSDVWVSDLRASPGIDARADRARRVRAGGARADHRVGGRRLRTTSLKALWTSSFPTLRSGPRPASPRS